jgi:hypothetical protein
VSIGDRADGGFDAALPKARDARTQATGLPPAWGDLDPAPGVYESAVGIFAVAPVLLRHRMAAPGVLRPPGADGPGTLRLVNEEAPVPERTGGPAEATE